MPYCEDFFAQRCVGHHWVDEEIYFAQRCMAHCARTSLPRDAWPTIFAHGAGHLCPHMEPQPVVYESRMKFAMKAGSTELAQEIFNFSSTDGGCFQHYMWLIRAAGQDGGADRAMTTSGSCKENRCQRRRSEGLQHCNRCLRRKQGHGPRGVARGMQKEHICVLVTYNTMMKGSTMAGDIYAAKGVLGHMAVDIVPASVASYFLLGSATELGNLKKACSVLRRTTRWKLRRNGR